MFDLPPLERIGTVRKKYAFLWGLLVLTVLVSPAVISLISGERYPPRTYELENTLRWDDAAVLGISSGCESDLDADGVVDLSDYGILIRDFLKATLVNSASDINKDGVVDLNDYSLLVRDFLKECSVPTSRNNYYVSPIGSDQASGDETDPFLTIQRAIDVVKSRGAADTTIWVAPGIYRESPQIVDVQATDQAPLQIAATSGSATTFVNGSETSQDTRISWVKSDDGQQFPTAARGHIYYADVSVWGGQPELAYLVSNNQQSIQRMNKAMEPDIDIFQAYEDGDERWIVDGGNGGAYNQILDAASDMGMQVGNLKSINGFSSNFLVGARVFIQDGYSGHDRGTAIVTAHDANSGKVTLDKDLRYFSGEPLVNLTSRYYVEGKPQLLDSPGEWYYDLSTKRLYIWPPGEVSPANIQIEFAVRNTGFVVKNSQNVLIDGFNVQFTNNAYGKSNGTEAAIYMYNSKTQSTRNITWQNMNIHHVGLGMRLFQPTENGNLTQNTVLRDSQIMYTDSYGIMVFNYPYLDSGGGYVPGVKGVLIENNEIGYGGFREDASGFLIWVQQASNMIFQNNYIHHSVHNGIEIQGGVQTNLIVRNNYFKDNCIGGSDCGAFKVWSSSASMRNVLVMNNIVDGTRGCSYAAEENNKGETSTGPGCWGFGYYSDIVHSTVPSEQAVIFYHNLSMHNSFAGFQVTRGQDHGFYSNLSYDQYSGINFSSGIGGTQSNKNTYVSNNFFLNYNDVPTLKSDKLDAGIRLAQETYERGNISINGNRYQMNGQASRDFYVRDISTFSTQKYFGSISEIRDDTSWESTGQDVQGIIFNDQVGIHGFDIGSTLNAAGIGSQVPPEVSGMASRLQTALGVSIDLNSTWVGQK